MKIAVLVAAPSRHQQGLEEHPNPLQVLGSLFGNRFDFPVLD